MGEKSLKAKNGLVIGSVLLADTVFFAVFAAWPTVGFQSILANSAVTKAGIAILIPVAVLLLGSLLPSSLKAILVFWRLRDVLPGHRAFNETTLCDPRIDCERLRKHVGKFPSNPGEQNAMWYRLFKQVETDESILHIHGQFLLFRDIASISTLLIIGSTLSWHFGLFPDRHILALAGIFSVQFLLSALSAQSQGKRLVCSVLALHGVKRRV